MHVTTKSITFVIEITSAPQLAFFFLYAMFKVPCTYHGDVLLKGVREMTKTASKPGKRKPGEWEQEFVAQLEKQGAWPPKTIKLTPLDRAALCWGKAQCYSSRAEGLGS